MNEREMSEKWTRNELMDLCSMYGNVKEEWQQWSIFIGWGH